MGQRLPKILRGAGIAHSVISTPEDFSVIGQKLTRAYRKNSIHAFLLSPAIWEESSAKSTATFDQRPVVCMIPSHKREAELPQFTRYELLEFLVPYFEGKVVVSNLGWPSKELYALKHQLSNFYMLGSMGMASPIGLGISLSSNKEVVVIDGDGSLLMNPGVLATAAHCAPENLTIVAIDNSSYGSTGSQETLTGSCVDLELVARGFGIGITAKAATKKQLVEAMAPDTKGLKFIHALALPGNKDVPNIPVNHITIRDQVLGFLKK
jgi:sulfopyruvate decarboxylase subunit beta